MSTTEFQAVDLDAVLDAFESSQDLVDENESKLVTSKQDETKSEAILKPNLLEDLNGESSAIQVNKNFTDMSYNALYTYYVLSTLHRENKLSI